MPEILLFAGTTEGRELAEYLAERDVQVKVFVATEYGEILLSAKEGLTVHTGRMDRHAMEAVFSPDTLVIDATHPYAAEVTRNLKEACANRNAEYLRLSRPSVGTVQTVTVENTAQAAAYLSKRIGNVLLTTGSKELSAFSVVPNGAERLYARVLPAMDALEKCSAIGLQASHIIAMQGPFSRELNLAMLRQTQARYLVTKDSGTLGGFPEKLAAAEEAGVTVVMIVRPGEETGLSLAEMKKCLSARFAAHFQERSGYFPLFVDLFGKSVLVVGGGTIAERRVRILLRYGAVVTVIAPELTPELQALEGANRITVLQRCYQEGDCANMHLAVASAKDRNANSLLAQEAKRRGIPVSVADQCGEGSFFFPAVFEGGGVSGGLISLEGKNHALVKRQAERIRNMLE